jgi:hypothetical protein
VLPVKVPTTFGNCIGIQESVHTHSLDNTRVPRVLPFSINPAIDDQMTHVNTFRS